MAKMGFRLEQVLNYRKEVEKVRTLELVTARQEFEGACERLKQEERKVDHLNTEFLERQRAGISVMDLQLYADFFQRKSADIKLQRLEADNLNSRMTEKQTILVKAALEKKVLESLKDKKTLAHKREMVVKEQAFLEELSLRKGHR
jgi:flagellar FliJ protein